MRLIPNAEVRANADPDEAVAAIRRAFGEQAQGAAALQARHRIAAGATKISTMAAILPSEGVAGAKVYTTVDGRFRFLMLLFDAATGEPLACMEADAFTELRTAAVTVAATESLANPDADVLAVFGTGVQAGANLRALARRLPLREIRVVSRGDATEFCTAMAAATGLPVVQAAADEAVAGAGVVVTATRAKAPLFHGTALSPGAFVAALGSTLPDAAELDATTFIRAASVVVEWAPQALAEAGDLLLAESAGAFDHHHMIELAAALADPSCARPDKNSIVIYKSVGIALEDVAVAAAIWRRITGAD
ncbi:MAG: ornithine cyclodeaminase family protein [Alphaproteobacteria bacterium]